MAATSGKTFGRCPLRRVAIGGFSLIELLVTISIIAVLISLLLPALGKAKALCRQTREMASAQQLAIAYALYSDSSRGELLPGYTTDAMVAGPVKVTDDQGNRITGPDAQRYPWRLAPMFNYDFRGLYSDDKVLTQFRTQESSYIQFGRSYTHVVSNFPSFGYNVAFVGGSANDLGFNQTSQRLFGKFYVTKLDEVRVPSRLVAFMSARVEEQPILTAMGRLDGFHRIEAPYFNPNQPTRWESTYVENTPSASRNSGYVSLRHSGKTISLTLDGHVSMLNWDEVRDMRRWANAANAEAWTLQRQ
ncbi:MAG: type II secretion system protein [Planctomycetota bacterium]|nr:type II secretion system protein [Planctomycetota bacterium]